MRTLFIFGLVIGSHVAFGISFHCARLDSGVTAQIDFDSDKPLFTEVVVGSFKTLISSSGACDKAFDLAAHCEVNLINQGEDYSYGFRCDDVFGDLYFTEQNGGAAQFRCFGEGVATEYNDRIYRRCTIAP